MRDSCGGITAHGNAELRPNSGRFKIKWGAARVAGRLHRIPSRTILAGMNVLFVHASAISALGGAELSLAEHIRGAPEGVHVDIATLEEEPKLSDYDAVVLANIRPSGGLGEVAEAAPALMWVKKLREYKGFSLKTERDIHPCTYRDARCIIGRRLRFGGCECSTLMRDTFSALYEACSAVQFLSPAHKKVINRIVEVRAPQYVIAPPVELARFGVTKIGRAHV